jgi:hypothetical protein
MRSNSFRKEERAYVQPLFPEGFLPHEERAQAEAVFRLMIDSIIGLAVLVIIMSCLSYFTNLSFEQSMNDLRDLVKGATSSPDGKVLGKSNLSFPGGRVISTSDFEYWTQISSTCFSIQSVLGSVSVTGSGASLEIQQTTKTNVSAKCLPRSCDPSMQQEEGNCCYDCTVSFGRQLE